MIIDLKPKANTITNFRVVLGSTRTWHAYSRATLNTYSNIKYIIIAYSRATLNTLDWCTESAQI